MRAVYGRRSFQDLRQPCGQARVAESSVSAGELIAILEITELIFQLDKLGGEEQVLGGVVRNVVGDGVVPDVLFRGRQSRFCILRGLQGWSGGLDAFVRLRGVGSRPGFVIERVMKINPESAVKLEDGKRPVAEIVLCLGCRSNGSEQGKGKQQKRESRWRSASHSESHDSSAKFPRAQIPGNCGAS